MRVGCQSKGQLPCGDVRAVSGMFSHFALISVELANTRKLSAAPICVLFKREALFEALVEHFIPWLQVVDEEETVRFPRRLFVQPVQLLLRQQGAELLNDGVQLVLVAQPAAEELLIDPHRCADEPQLEEACATAACQQSRR